LIPAICDSREQRPWTFDSETFSVEVAGLKAGDYSLKGMETRVAVERKSLNDLLGSITHGRVRFQRELQLLRSYEHAALIVEASWEQIELGSWPLVKGKPCSAVHPNSVAGTLVSIHTRYVPVLLAGDRLGGQSLCARLLRRWWLDSQASEKEELKAT
jgi:DNA excision repair protein ERCC-4